MKISNLLEDNINNSLPNYPKFSENLLSENDLKKYRELKKNLSLYNDDDLEKPIKKKEIYNLINQIRLIIKKTTEPIKKYITVEADITTDKAIAFLRDSDLDNEFQKNIQELKNERNTIRQKKVEINELNNKLEKTENERKKLQNNIIFLQNEKGELQNEKEKLRNEKEELLINYNIDKKFLKNDINNLNNEVDNLKNKIETLESKIIILQNERDDLKNKLSELEKKNQELINDNKKIINNEIPSYKIRISELENEIRRLRDTNERLTKTLNMKNKEFIIGQGVNISGGSCAQNTRILEFLTGFLLFLKMYPIYITIAIIVFLSLVLFIYLFIKKTEKHRLPASESTQEPVSEPFRGVADIDFEENSIQLNSSIPLKYYHSEPIQRYKENYSNYKQIKFIPRNLKSLNPRSSLLK